MTASVYVYLYVLSLFSDLSQQLLSFCNPIGIDTVLTGSLMERKKKLIPAFLLLTSDTEESHTSEPYWPKLEDTTYVAELTNGCKLSAVLYHLKISTSNSFWRATHHTHMIDLVCKRRRARASFIFFKATTITVVLITSWHVKLFEHTYYTLFSY